VTMKVAQLRARIAEQAEAGNAAAAAQEWGRVAGVLEQGLDRLQPS
jgi:hypothetical protein